MRLNRIPRAMGHVEFAFAPDMQKLCDHIHALGLKVGIYSTPWRTSYAGYPGSCQKEKQDAKQWAEWGVDFLKYDWDMHNPQEPSEDYVTSIRHALDTTGRDILLSLSNSAPISKGEFWSTYANMWRTSGDITDTWESMSGVGFHQDGWEKFAGPGHWNDPDMLVVGYVGWGDVQRPSRLTQEEQITHFTLWCMLAAPLILGCDLTRIDDFLLSVLTNDEILAVNQDALGAQGFRVSREADKEVWLKPLSNGKKAVTMFNRGEQDTTIQIDWEDIGILGDVHLRDLGHRQNSGPISGALSVAVKAHGAEMFLLG